MAFMGMGMAGQAGGMNAQNLFQMGQQQQMQQQAAQPAPAPAVQGGRVLRQSGITGNFCPNCGSKKPEPSLRPRAEVCLWCNCYRKILPGMRQTQACSCGRRLDMFLRRGEQGKVLPLSAGEETRRGSQQV